MSRTSTSAARTSQSNVALSIEREPKLEQVSAAVGGDL
jgi:hypothetical protein